VGGVSNAVNPYAAPAAPVEDIGANPEAEAIRRAHIHHEASIKAVGFLYYLGGTLVTLAGLASLFGLRSSEGAVMPHVKYRTSIVVWIFLALVIGLVVIAVLGAFPGR
jgi:hypothetical protein